MSSHSEQIEQEAKKIASKKSFHGKIKKPGKAADKFKQAGNSYKVDRNFKKAGECHMTSYNLYLQSKEKACAADEALEAAKCFRIDNTLTDEAVNAYKEAASVYLTMNNRGQNAGQCYEDAADLLIERSLRDEALEMYQISLDTFIKAETNEVHISRLLDRYGDQLTEAGKYREAVDAYDKAITMKLKDRLTQGTAVLIFFKKVLAYLQLDDTIGASKMIKEFLVTCPTYKLNDDYQFLLKLIDAIEQKDINQYDDLIKEYRRTNIVDDWTSNRFLDMRQYADGNDEYVDPITAVTKAAKQNHEQIPPSQEEKNKDIHKQSPQHHKKRKKHHEKTENNTEPHRAEQQANNTANVSSNKKDLLEDDVDVFELL